MKHSFFTIIFVLIITSLNSCNNLETIPVVNENQSIDNRFYTFSTKHKFGEIPSTRIKVNKTQKSKSISYIESKIKTRYIKFNESTKLAWLFKLLKWLGVVTVILIAAFGFFLIKPTNKKAQKRKNLFRIIISQFPIVAFFYFVSYSYLYIYLWHALIVVALIVGSSSEFKKKHLFVVPIAIILLAWFGYKAGPKVYIDNALDYPVVVNIDEISSTTLPAKSHTLVRISGEKSNIIVTKDESVIEEIKLPINSTNSVLIYQALFPWKKYIYNINGHNKYSLQKVSYR